MMEFFKKIKDDIERLTEDVNFLRTTSSQHTDISTRFDSSIIDNIHAINGLIDRLKHIEDAVANIDRATLDRDNKITAITNYLKCDFMQISDTEFTLRKIAKQKVYCEDCVNLKRLESGTRVCGLDVKYKDGAISKLIDSHKGVMRNKKNNCKKYTGNIPF